MVNLIADHIDIWTSAKKPKTNGGRGRRRNGNKDRIYGIKKLRELILELAVRGKLVPQDPNDEPASVFLKRITEEKKRLVKEGKIKKQKVLPGIAEAENRFELPYGWKFVSLSQLGVFSGGKTPSKSKNFYWNGDIPWVTPKDMKTPKIFNTEDHVTKKAIEDGLTLYDSEAILVVVRSGIFRHSFPVAIAKVSFTVNQDLKVLSLIKKELASYISVMMKGFERHILKTLTKTGVTVESIIFNQFSQYPFPLPPLAEQQRIVTKVEELVALCDQLEQQQIDSNETQQALVETLLTTLTSAADPKEFADTWQRIADYFDILFTTEQSIDQLKQTILQLAVMGKLVPQDPNDAPASVLLEQITKEKKRLVMEGKIKRQKALPGIGNDEKPFKLPNGWEWIRFNKLVNPIYPLSYGVLVPGPNVDDGIPFVRIGDLDLTNPPLHPEKTIDSSIDQKYERTRLHGSELLMGVVGSIGKLGIVPDSWRGANIARAICRIAPTPHISKKYMIC